MMSEEKKIEDLLKPRYKVIADYPGLPSSMPVGFIIKEDETLPYFMRFVVSNYPHLFRKLEWWEDRKPEEMPKYVKWNKKSAKITETGVQDKSVLKVIEYVIMTHETFARWGDCMGNSINIGWLDPATEKDFLNQKL